MYISKNIIRMPNIARAINNKAYGILGGNGMFVKRLQMSKTGINIMLVLYRFLPSMVLSMEILKEAGRRKFMTTDPSQIDVPRSSEKLDCVKESIMVLIAINAVNCSNVMSYFTPEPISVLHKLI